MAWVKSKKGVKSVHLAGVGNAGPWVALARGLCGDAVERTAADLNGDGSSEVIAGYRGKGRSVYIYYPEEANGEHWSKHILDDGGMASAACAAADLNGDGRTDIASIGSATTNLKWYENLGPAGQ